MAYRTSDDFLYAVQGKDLLRVDAEGDIENIGPSGGAAGAYTGDIGDDGKRYVSKGGKNWHAIDLDTMEVTAVDGMNITESGPADVANVHGMLYGIGKQGDLFIFDPANQTATKGLTVAGLPSTPKPMEQRGPRQAATSMWGATAARSTRSPIFGQHPQATQVATAPNTNSNDASCPTAPTPPGLNDVDGPKPETEPQTPEAKEASDNYEENYDEISELFGPQRTLEKEMPEEHPPVETTEETYETTPESNVETGDACEANVREDRLPRVDVPDIEAFTEPTVLFGTDFGTPPLEHFKILNGRYENNTFAQAHDRGYDTTVAHRARWSTTTGGSPVRQHQRRQPRWSTAEPKPLDTQRRFFVDLAEGGNVVRWGYYDDKGYYQQVQTFPIARPGTGEEVTLAAEVRGTAVALYFNGQKLGDVTAPYAGGLVGLVVNATPVAFHEVTLTGLPQ